MASDVKCTASFSTRLTIDWKMAAQRSPQFGEWRLRRTEPSGVNPTIDVITTARVFIDVTGLEPNSSYTFAVDGRAVQTTQQMAMMGNSGWTEVGKVTAAMTKTKPRALRPMPMDHETLTNYILNFKVDPIYHHLYPEECEKYCVNILIFGPFGSGKSTLVNTIFSSLASDLTRPSKARRSKGHVTGSFTKYCLSENQDLSDRIITPINLFDPWGFDKSNYNSGELELMLDGKLPSSWQKDYSSNHFILQDDPRLNQFPTMEDMMHCVLFVIDAENDFPLTERKEDFEKFRPAALKRGLRLLVLLTKIDRVDSTLDPNPEKYFQSEIIPDLVEQVVNELGVEPNEVFPIKNYELEAEKTHQIDCMAMNLLRNSLKAANDFFQFQNTRLRDTRSTPVKPRQVGTIHNPGTFSPTHVSEKDKKVAQLIAEAANYLEENDFEKVKDLCSEILRLDGSNRRGLLLHTHALSGLGLVKEALSSALLLQQNGVNDVPFQIILGKLQIQDGRYQEGRQTLTRLSEDAPSPEIYLLLGKCQEDLGSYKEAMEFYQKAIQAGGPSHEYDRLKKANDEFDSIQREINLGDPKVAYSKCEALMKVLRNRKTDLEVLRMLAAVEIFKKTTDLDMFAFIGKEYNRLKHHPIVNHLASTSQSATLHAAEENYLQKLEIEKLKKAQLQPKFQPQPQFQVQPQPQPQPQPEKKKYQAPLKQTTADLERRESDIKNLTEMGFQREEVEDLYDQIQDFQTVLSLLVGN